MITTVNPGKQLDHYRIDSFAARGSTAAIFRGTDLRTGHAVAIKIPHPEIETDPVLFERFHREEELAKSLSHPGLLNVVQDDHRSQHYVVTEWFEGQSLRHLLAEEQKLPQERAIRISLRLLDALSYIHNHGVVHRDLKPENILVDGADRIKLMNFRVAAKAWSPRITFTNLSQVVGMSEYLSPEEVGGNRGNARSDLYSVGVILYQMLTGEMPFPESNGFDHLLQDPIPPHDVDPTISPQLQEVILRAMERKPKHRYASAQEMANDLGHLDRVRIRSRRITLVAPRLPVQRWIVFLCLGLLPVIIFALLFYFARH